MTDLTRITEALKANRIPYNRKFDMVRAAGYDSDECQRLSEEIITQVDGLVAEAINGNGDVNGAIDELTNIAVKLSEKGAGRKVAAYTAKKDSILKQLSRRQRGEKDMQLKEKTIEYLDDAISAINIVIEVASSEEARENLRKASAKLEEIKSNVSEAWDEKSKTAAGYMGDILENVEKVIEKASNYSCDLEGLDYLSEAVKTSAQWKKLNAAVRSKRDTADEKFINEQWKRGYDAGKVDLIKQSVYVANKIHLFVDDLNAYKYETERLCSADKLNANIAKRREKIEQLTNEAKSASVKLRNGELSKEAATKIVARCKAEMDNNKGLLAADEKRLAQLDSLRRARDLHAEECESLVDQFLFYERDPVMLAAIAKSGAIDFDQIRAMIGGRLTKESFQKVKGTIQVNLAIIAANQKAIIEGSATWNEINSEVQESIFETTEQEQTNDQDLDEMLKEMGIYEDKPEVKVEEEEEVVDGTIALSETDK